ncbi:MULTISPECIES: serine hydrolase [unclassified Pseudoalteromonas]|uniref:serine hydrolase domain-containing protein n=1 Tax=unclassified Pseudoalteromonas TaxID=194690 RepID=UPI0005A5E01F|nr:MULTISPECIES: serine hydrolase domain-containing protein [unclassified Pseudoalteromonas]
MMITNTIKSALFGATVSVFLTACGGSDSTTEVQEQAKVVTPEPVAFDYQSLIDNKISSAVPGIILLVNTPDREFIGSAGVSDIENQTPMQTSDTFHIASTGKVFIGLLAAQLHQDGLLNLDDTLDTWLPSDLLTKIQYSDKITLRQLLNHSSGIYNYGDTDKWKEDALANPEQEKGNAELVEYALNKPAEFEPGTGWHYSNTNYNLAGMILDTVLGSQNAYEMRDRILSPLSLEDTFSVGVENNMIELIPGYETINGQHFNTKDLNLKYTSAAAPIASSVSDVAHFTRSMFKDPNFINDDIRDLMWGTDSLVKDKNNENYGLGMSQLKHNGANVYFHSGGNPGYSSENFYFEAQDISIVLFLNCGGSDECLTSFKTIRDKVIEQVTKS